MDFDKFWNYKEPQQTFVKFKEIFENLDVSDISKIPIRIELLTQMARTYSLQNQMEESKEILSQAKLLLDKHNQSKDLDLRRPKVRYFLEKGRMHNSSNEKYDAISLFQQAWDLAQQSKEDNLAVDAAHMLGITEEADRAIEWNEIAMKFAEDSEDEKAKNWLGSLYNNLAWTYHDKNEFEKALVLFEKAFEYRKKKQGKLHEQTIIGKWMISEFFCSQYHHIVESSHVAL